MNALSFLFTCLFIILFYMPVKCQWETVQFGEATASTAFDFPYVWMLSAVDSNVCWAVLGRGFDDFSSNRFLRTSDGGATWVEGTIPDNNMDSYTISILAIDSLKAWAIRNSLPEENTFVYKTSDGGTNWSEVSLPFTNDNNVLIGQHFFNALDGFIYSETNDGQNWYIEVFYTIDGGLTWQTANTPFLAGERVFIWHGNNNFAVQGDTIWFGTSLSRVFRSVDKGHNWEAITVPTWHTRPLESIAFLDANNGIVATALSDSLGGSLAYNEALRTTDGGISWTHIPIPNDIMYEPRMMGLAAIPGSDGAYMMYGYWQHNFEYKQMISLDHGITWNYVEGSENKIRCLQFLSPETGWGGGWDYLFLTITEKVFKWSGPPILGGVTSLENEWNRLQAALELSPNPAVDLVKMEISESSAENYLIEIFEMKGLRLYSGILESNTSKTLEVGQWPAGTYILKVSGQKGMTARVFIRAGND